MTSFGIDLGTTNSSIAQLVDGKPIPLPVDGDPIVPSVVLYQNDRVIVGRAARNLELQFPEATIRSVKRKMGQDFRFSVLGKELSPEDVSAQILSTLKRGAESATGQTVSDVVITVPAYFDDAQRRATLKAGELAGLNVLRLLNEPTSASLVYDQVTTSSQLAAPEIVMIYDLGGGTFDVSILEVFEGVREVRSTTGNTHLGGDDFDEALVRLFVDSIKIKSGSDPLNSPRAKARLRSVAEKTKIALSIETEVEVREEFLTTDDKGNPVHLQLKVKRRQFEKLITPLLESTIELARKALADANLVGGQTLSRICLVGGSTRIPLARNLLCEAFSADIHEEVDPDLAVALGASVQAGILTGETLSRILVDVASHSLGVRAISESDYLRDEPDTFAPVLRRNTVLPATRTEEFYTVVNDQEGINVEVFQGESPRVSQNTSVGSFFFKLKPTPAHSAVRFEFAYDLNSVVKVSVLQSGTENSKTVALSVADSSKNMQAGESPIERRARTLLETLTDEEDRTEISNALEIWRAAAGDAKEEAEAELLDLFLDFEDGDSDDKE